MTTHLDVSAADDLLSFVIVRLERLQDSEKKDSQAIPRDVLTVGELFDLLNSVTALVCQAYPELGEDELGDLAESCLRSSH